MDIKKININGKEYEFVNESYNTRNGFGHRSRLFVNGCDKGEARCTYYNRTWECYQYQTVMLKVMRQLCDCRQNHLDSEYRNEHNIKRMTEKHKIALGDIWAKDELLNEYKAVIEALH